MLKGLASVAAKFFRTDVIVIDSLILCKHQTKECTGNQTHSVPGRPSCPTKAFDRPKKLNDSQCRFSGEEITLEGFHLGSMGDFSKPSSGINTNPLRNPNVPITSF